MMDKIVNLIKDNNLTVPKLLLNSYAALKINDRELIILIFLINNPITLYNPNLIAKEIGLKTVDVLTCVNSLSEKGFLEIEIRKIDKLREEHIILDNLYKRLAFLIINEKEQSTDIYSIFETEFGRTLSPIEYEIISKWIDEKYSEELVLAALKEAVFNNVSSLNYIDKILQDWKKKGIKTIDDVEKDKLKFKSKKETPQKLFDYDWLNEK